MVFIFRVSVSRPLEEALGSELPAGDRTKASLSPRKLQKKFPWDVWGAEGSGVKAHPASVPEPWNRLKHRLWRLESTAAELNNRWRPRRGENVHRLSGPTPGQVAL